MNQPAFSLDFTPVEHPFIAAARSLASDLTEGVSITRTTLRDTFTRLTGASDADHGWCLSDAYAAVEVAQLLWLQSQGSLTPRSAAAAAFTTFDWLDGMTPVAYNRSEEQIRLQQFSTPVRLAWVAARAAGISHSSLVLEPSAGTGMLAFWARAGGAQLVLNEIDPERRAALEYLFPDVGTSITTRLLVFDKVSAAGVAIVAHAATVNALVDCVDALPQRAPRCHPTAPSKLRSLPVNLFARSRRPMAPPSDDELLADAA